MARDLLQLVKSVVTQKQQVSQKERQLITDLNRALGTIGYEVITTSRASAGPGRNSSPARAAASAARRSLPCPRCDRRFSRPVHLGRHLSATHGVKKK